MNKTITISGKKVELTNQRKVFWPAGSGINGQPITKGDLISYYQKIASVLLPYIKDRPMTMRRFPDGITGEMFYQQHAPASRPDWLKTTKIRAKSTGQQVEHIIVNDEASLIYLVNLGCIDIYPWLSTWQQPNYPREIVFDLDARDIKDFSKVLKVALTIKTLLDDEKIESFVKTSGSTGLHILVPLVDKITYSKSRKFAKRIAEKAQEILPDLISLKSQATDRGSKILIDYSQNGRGKTLAAPYSVRPVPDALVSTPVTWQEVEKGIKLTDFNIENIFSRLKKIGDVYHDLLDKNRFNLD